MKRFSAALSLAILAVWPLSAQTSGSFTGQVTDSSGAAIVGVTVAADNLANGQHREATTDSGGRYTIPDVPIGKYKLTVAQKGFETAIQQPVGVAVGQSVPVNFTLTPGAVNQAITVTGEAPIVDPNQGQGETLNNRDVQELPINGRDYGRFSLLTPGAVARSNYIADLSFDGLHSVHNQFAIDGIDATRVDQPYMSNGFERGARLLTGSLDTIAEFRVQTSNYRAEYGRAAGSYVNIATKSGANQFHGDAYDYLRNDFFDARNFFNTKPTPMAKYRFNDFGGNVGGPIKKDKTFFFANYEGSRQLIGITTTGTVLSALGRADVLTTSPALTPVVDIIPLGNGSITSDPRVQNYATTGVSNVREDTGSIRIDQNFSERNSAYVRVNVNDSHVFGPLFGVINTAFGLTDFQNVPVRTSNFAVHDTEIFSPTFINEFEVGMQRWGSHIISNEAIPMATITGLTITPGDEGYYKDNNTSYQIGDTMSKSHGSHNFKWGVNEYRIQIDQKTLTQYLMTFASLNDFINNKVSNAQVLIALPGISSWAYQTGAFVQDTWHVKPTLTLDYGLRYDFETPPYDPAHRAQTFDTRTNTLGPPGDPYFKDNLTDFGPRFAFAWQVTPKTVIRSGYGIFYQTYPVGFGAYSVPANNIPGNTTLSNLQIPNLSYPLTPFLSRGVAPPPTVSGFNWDKPDIYVQQWNFTVEQQLSDSTALTVAYVGNHGLNLRRNLNINFFDPALGRRPIPGFSDVNIETASGQDVYHSLQVSLVQRFRHGFQGQFNYTWAHAIDDVQDQGLFSAQPQDNNNFKAERGNSSGDIRHNFSYGLVYGLPFGNGQRFLGNASGLTQRVLGGWQLASLAIIHSGVADTVYIGSNPFGNGNFTNQRPNAVPNVSQYAANPSVNGWLNPAAFSMPANGTFGNLGRNTFYGPKFVQIDTSLLKETPITEGTHLEFRAEVFNVFNHPNFGEPDSTFGTPGFGQIFQTFGATLGFGTSRQIQLAMKYIF